MHAPDAGHHQHYCLEKQPKWIQDLAAKGKLSEPLFIGQGWAERVGSDVYGGYVVSVKTLKNGKPVIGVVRASAKFTSSWTEGSMRCTLPGEGNDPQACKPDAWLTTYGKNGDGTSKWWRCSEDGKRFPGKQCFWSFNGCAAYRDPSF